MENSPELDIDSNRQERVDEAKLAYTEDLYNHLHDNQEENRDSETDIPAKKEGQISALMQLGSRSVEDHTKHQKQNMESGNDTPNHAEKETLRAGGETATSEQHKPKVICTSSDKLIHFFHISWTSNFSLLASCTLLFSQKPKLQNPTHH